MYVGISTSLLQNVTFNRAELLTNPQFIYRRYVAVKLWAQKQTAPLQGEGIELDKLEGPSQCKPFYDSVM